MVDILNYFQSKENNELNIIDFKEETLEKTFCPKCLKFPEYFIKFSSTSTFSLIHSCVKGKIIEKPLEPENKSKSLKFKCHYCEKECQNICLKCKYVLCEECFLEHNGVPLSDKIKIPSKKIVDDETFMNLINSQYFCDKHLYKYNFYCPVCKINLCDSCKKRHIHINCLNLLALNIKGEDIIEPSNVCLKKLYQLAKIFHSCYEASFNNSKMTMDILLNKILANNIIKFVQQNQVPSKGCEIKNNYLFNNDKNSYLCKKYDDSEFNANYSTLILSACGGNMMDYYRLYEIRNVYNVKILPNFFDLKTYHDALKNKISNLINSLDSIIGQLNISEIN